eukprot:SAG11_NODE_43849_length_161_cov_19.548387_1_plen_26_part_10
MDIVTFSGAYSTAVHPEWAVRPYIRN